MWCPDDIRRDSWDWVGPPAWGRACFNSPEWGGGSPDCIVVDVVCCCCVVVWLCGCVVVWLCGCVVVWLWLLCVVVVCCVLCVVCCVFHCFIVSLFFNACDVTTKLAPDAPSPRRKTNLDHAESILSTCSTILNTLHGVE